MADQRLVGKTALVTGGSSGQGAAEARLFAESGARVVIGDILDAEGQEVVRTIRAKGGVADYLHLDVASADNWAEAIAFVKAKSGALHILVNNAGIPLRNADFLSTKQSQWEHVLSVNLTGPFLGIQAAAPLMRDSGGGSIINTGSTAGLTGHFATAYSVSKWGLRGLTKSAAMEFTPWNIRVNAIHPCMVITPMVSGSPDFVTVMSDLTPLGRAATVEDIASVVLFLASDDSRYLTGIDVPIDGGFTGFGGYRQAVRLVKQRADAHL